MDERKKREMARRLMEARAIMVRENPFFGHLAMSMPLACASCGTACTDGNRLIFDPEFVEKLSDMELEFVMLHEILHCILEHVARGKNLNGECHNIACDIVVNSHILEMWGMKDFTIAGEPVMHLAPNGREGRKHNAEEVYEMLLRSSGKNGKSSGQNRTGKSSPEKDNTGQNRTGFDSHELWKANSQNSAFRDCWNHKIEQAIQGCSNISTLPPIIRQWKEDLEYRSRVNWRQILHDFLQQDEYDYDFVPPDRRYSDGDFFLPDFHLCEDRFKVDAWVCVDVSASISDKMLSDAIMEIRDAMRQVHIQGRLSFFDTRVTEPVDIEDESAWNNSNEAGCGGTSFQIIFDYMRDHMKPDLPGAILIFTDGYAPEPPEEAAMGVPVLWLIVKGGHGKLTWGKVARLE